MLALDGRCLVHDDLGDCSGPLQSHHVLTQQQLRKRGLADDLWDPANGMAVCERSHAAHTSGARRIERSRVPQRCVGVSVRDYGVGMDSTTRAQMFDPFFTTKGSGNGLGLAIAQQIVLRAGGFFLVDSEPGQGTTISVMLPPIE